MTGWLMAPKSTKAEAARTSSGLCLEEPQCLSAVFYWWKQITGQPRVNERWNRFHIFMQRVVKNFWPSWVHHKSGLGSQFLLNKRASCYLLILLSQWQTPSVSCSDALLGTGLYASPPGLYACCFRFSATSNQLLSAHFLSTHSFLLFVGSAAPWYSCLVASAAVKVNNVQKRLAQQVWDCYP